MNHTFVIGRWVRRVHTAYFSIFSPQLKYRVQISNHQEKWYTNYLKSVSPETILFKTRDVNLMNSHESSATLCKLTNHLDQNEFYITINAIFIYISLIFAYLRFRAYCCIFCNSYINKFFVC